MSKSKQAKSFLDDLLEGEDELAQEIANKEVEPEESDVQYIVYYKGDKPDCVWEYHHKPDDGIPYGRQYGYWKTDPENPNSREFKEHRSNNYKLMDFETFMDRVPPNKDCTKIFNDEADFLLDLI
ncbi:MAG: hypothetical protein KAS32_11510 [Candidatus Peribacteraceae bacterium]|nr:hypothetical protein [Candidatus Peribacteraceae bacterium]